MYSYQLIHKKRKPLFRITAITFVISIALLLTVSIFFENYSDKLLIRNVILWILFFMIVICILILGNSTYIKNVIGNVTFYADLIHLKIHGHEEKIYLADIIKIAFQLDGYQGLNKNPPSGFLRLAGLKTQTGLNNFIHFTLKNKSDRTIEFYIPNKFAWENIYEIANKYYLIINKENL